MASTKYWFLKKLLGCTDRQVKDLATRILERVAKGILALFNPLTPLPAVTTCDEC